MLTSNIQLDYVLTKGVCVGRGGGGQAVQAGLS